MSVDGSWPPSNCFKCIIWIQKGGHHFSRIFEIKKIVSISQVAVGSDKQCEQSKDHCDQSIQAVA